MNFWRGCHAVSEGCQNCYAAADHERYGMDFSKVTRTKTWDEPLRWQKALEETGRTELVFTCSWSDFFLPEADRWRDEAWTIIRRCPNLVWQILTKRPGLILNRLPADWWQKRCEECGRKMERTSRHDQACECGGLGECIPVPYSNVWLGVSVESKKWLWRIDTLAAIPAAIRFVSFEPLLESLMPEVADKLEDLDWAIVGGESGNGTDNFRPMDPQWAREIFEACKTRGIARFFKQSAARRSEMGTTLDGERIREYPEYPKVLATQKTFF
jgi:protein gp37